MRHSRLVILVLLGALAGCSAAGPDATAASPTPRVPRPLASVNLPAMLAREAANPYPEFDVGHTVQVTSQGFRPRALASSCCDPVVFKNMTDVPVTIVFDNRTLAPGTVPARGTWSFVPKNPESVTFHLESDPNTRGSIQVEAGE